MTGVEGEARRRRARSWSPRALSRLAIGAALAIACLGGLLGPPAAAADEPAPGTATASQQVTWSCTSSPCPWGGQTTGHAVVWTADLNPISTRHGYTTSAPIYAPGTTTTGYQVTIQSGTARVYAGTPTGDHRRVGTIAAGETLTLPSIDAGEVFSVQADDPFTFTLTPGTPPPPPVDPAPGTGTASALVTWSCTSSPCPWGDRTTGHAVVWPAALSPISTRHGYTTSAPIYAPGTTAAGYQVTVHTGTARVYAGTPTGDHRPLGTVAAGATLTLPTIGTGEVFSVQADDPFSYTLTAGTPPPPPDDDPTPGAGTASRLVTWSCTGTPCPWGGQTTGHAVVWPSALDPISTRHGYTTSAPIYAPGTTATGYEVTVHTGSARVYAGTPAGDHRPVGTIAAGATLTLPTIDTGEVFSVQADDPFSYTLTAGTPPPPPDDDPAPGAGATSRLVTWSCTGSPCPWGDQTTGHAVVWPADLEPTSSRHGYTTSAAIYAPGSTTAGYEVTVHTGTARIYAGTPTGTHRAVATVAAGETSTLPAIDVDEVFSVQADDPFTYTLTAGTPPPPPCRDPLTCDPVTWTPSFWRCNTPDCTGGGSPGGVVTWPSWSAYESNGRSGLSSWTVYGEDGETLYPYMGPWAEGCEVTVRTGQVLVIEWQRGTDQWRETLLSPGETHTIHLVGAENGAMIETPNNTEPFSVSIDSCTPQPVDKG